MRTMIFISRHTPTPAQIEIAENNNFNLVHVGDMDAFSPDLLGRIEKELAVNDAAFVCCVHPMIAMKAIDAGAVGVGMFENAARAAEGEKPTFDAVALHTHYPKSNRDDELWWIEKD